ncbi:MAG: ABC transporter ATP-binding protein, partial [Cellulosilyticaceae bacterium]
DSEKLDEATQSAQILDLLEQVEDHFEHRVSQNGSNLSGGQKQRISVARTLYRKSDLVILDDVSSALDYKTDLKLRMALRKNYKQQTVILISQRVSSIKNADKILVLEKGKSVGLGTHEQLLKECAVYQKMCETQERGRS